MYFRLIFSILVFKISLAFGCPGCCEDDPDIVQFQFLEKKDNIFLQITQDLNYSATYNLMLWDYQDENKKKNIEEWKKVLLTKYSFEDIEAILYKRNKSIPQSEFSTNSSLKELAEYIKFVESQEKCADFDEYTPRPQLNTCEDLIPTVLDNLGRVNNKYIKLRYFYLALRLGHYNNTHEYLEDDTIDEETEKERIDFEPLHLYEEYKYLLAEYPDSIVNDWIQGIYAGALVKSGQKVQGVYEFSKLFDKVNKYLAFYNFYINTQKEFDELLSLAKNSDEKAIIYTLRALNSSSNIIEEIQNIQKIDKSSKWLSFLIYRELLKSLTFFNESYYGYSYLNFNKYNEEYLTFLKSLNNDDDYLVGLSLTYFNIYSKEFDEAKKVIGKLLIKYPKSNEIHNAYVVLNLMKVYDSKKIDEKAEDEIFKQIQAMKQLDENGYPTPIYRFTLYLLLDMYKNQGLDVDAALVGGLVNISLGNIDLKTFRKVEEFLNKPQTSKLKQHIQSTFNEKLKVDEEYFGQIYGNHKFALLFSNLKFKEALNTNIPYLNIKLEFNPFNAQIRGNNRSGKTNQITLKEFLEKIVTVEKVLEKDPKSTMDNFLYANAIYNLSHFGNNAKLTYDVGYYSGNYLDTTEKQDIQRNKLYTALRYYKNALKNTNNKELISNGKSEALTC